MTIEEAMNKYGIPIPENIFEYDKEMYREFDVMYLQSFYNTFYSKESINSQENKDRRKIAVVLGGQTGAGKSSLVSETKREFLNAGRRIVLIDDDQYRKLYPYSKEILANCPELYTKITATATNKITPKILQFASDNGYNFIFDGTMKNQRIIETMKGWKDYNIQVKIMAASRLRSLTSIVIRNGELREKGEEGRHIAIESHDETYHGIPKTLRYLEQTNLADEIKIYTRGIKPFFPKEEYSSVNNPMISSADSLEKLRKLDEERFLKTVDEEIKYIEELIKRLSKEEQEEAYKIINIVREGQTKNLDFTER